MIETIWLAKGSHPDAADCGDPQRCLFEWYNHLDRGMHTDTCPPGVSPVLHVYGMRLNDCLPDDKRQQLAWLLPNGASPLAGTAGDGKDETRGYIALDWIVRTYLPAWLDLMPELATHARLLRAGAPVTCMDAARETGPVVDAARAAAGDAARAAAWAAARDAARAAAWAAAGDAAGAAAGDAARDAARAAAGAAAWAAAWDAAWAAAGAAAWAAARDAARAAAVAAAGDAAGAAAGDAAWDAARAAARDAARDVLAPVMARLQDSAIALYGALIAGEWPA
jgi:hypothetical protein